MFSILISLASFEAASYLISNLTVALILISGIFSGTYPESFIFYLMISLNFFIYSTNTLFLSTYSLKVFVAFSLSESIDSVSSIFPSYPVLNRDKTPLRASLGSFLFFTALNKSGKSRDLSFFTTLSLIYLLE